MHNRWVHKDGMHEILCNTICVRTLFVEPSRWFPAVIALRSPPPEEINDGQVGRESGEKPLSLSQSG